MRFVTLLLLIGTISLAGCGDNSTNSVTPPASVSGVLTLPADATGEYMYVIIDNDAVASNGHVKKITKSCGPGTYVSYSFDEVPAGTYYVQAAVYTTNSAAHDPSTGDYRGYYGGTGLIAPAEANAVVPNTGSATFNFTLNVIP